MGARDERERARDARDREACTVRNIGRANVLHRLLVGGVRNADMAKTAVSGSEFPIRELREYVLGNLDVEHQDASPAALVEDPEVREVLIFMDQVYEPKGDMPADFWDTRFAREALRKHVDKKAARALASGNEKKAGAITGLVNYEPDMSGLRTVDQVEEWLIQENQVKTVYLSGTQGAGKTDFSLLLCEIVARHFERASRVTGAGSSVPEPEFATNFTVDVPEGVDYRKINEYGTLVDWLDGSSDDEKWFVFDEASTELTAQTGKNSQKVVEYMAELYKKGRKAGLSGLIVVGHDGRDVAPLFRELADYAHKRDTKEASVYASVREREGAGHMFDLSGIPQTTWDYDTDDTADWSWEGGTEPEGVDEETRREWRDEHIRSVWEVAPEDMTKASLASAFDVSAATVTRALD